MLWYNDKALISRHILSVFDINSIIFCIWLSMGSSLNKDKHLKVIIVMDKNVYFAG